MASSSNYSSQGGQRKSAARVGVRDVRESGQNQEFTVKDARDIRLLQSVTRSGSGMIKPNSPAVGSITRPTTIGPSRALSSPKTAKDGRTISISDQTTQRAVNGALEVRTRAPKYRSLPQGREISSATSTPWHCQAEGGSALLGPRSSSAVVNPHFEGVALGPPTGRIQSASVSSSPFLMVGTSDDSGTGGYVATTFGGAELGGSAAAQRQMLSARGSTASRLGPRGWGSLASQAPASSSLHTRSLPSMMSSLALSGSTPPPESESLRSAVDTLENFASRQEDRVLQGILHLFVARLDASRPKYLTSDRHGFGAGAGLGRLAEAGTQTDLHDADLDPDREAAAGAGSSSWCGGSDAGSADPGEADGGKLWQLSALDSPRESGDEWFDDRTASSAASVSSRVASSTAASQCATLPVDPADFDLCPPHGKPGLRPLDALWCQSAGGRSQAPSFDTLLELQRFLDLHYPRMLLAQTGGAGEEAGCASSAATARCGRSPCPWSPATMEIRRLAQDALRAQAGARPESPSVGACVMSHPLYRPPNPGGGGWRSGGGPVESARADSDSLSSSGTPASNPKLTPRLGRSPPQHVTRAPRPSRDGAGGGPSPRLPLPETLTPRPGPGSTGDSPLSTPRDRSAFLAPPAKARAYAPARTEPARATT